MAGGDLFLVPSDGSIDFLHQPGALRLLGEKKSIHPMNRQKYRKYTWNNLFYKVKTPKLGDREFLPPPPGLRRADET